MIVTENKLMEPDVINTPKNAFSDAPIDSDLFLKVGDTIKITQAFIDQKPFAKALGFKVGDTLEVEDIETDTWYFFGECDPNLSAKTDLLLQWNGREFRKSPFYVCRSNKTNEEGKWYSINLLIAEESELFEKV